MSPSPDHSRAAPDRAPAGGKGGRTDSHDTEGETGAPRRPAPPAAAAPDPDQAARATPPGGPRAGAAHAAGKPGQS